MRVWVWSVMVLMAGCALSPEVPMDRYETISKQHLSELAQWALDGRISISSPNDSWSANLEWQRNLEEDVIRLAGPLGQGAVVIHLDPSGVGFDKGDGRLQHSDNPDLFVKEQLGVFVPVKALRYWVIGLPDPSREVTYELNGFEQERWKVEYKEWQVVSGIKMPRKINVTSGPVKLKLVCDQWETKWN